jgi:putative transposase
MPTTYDPQRHHRRSLRLKGYDYTQEGAYYVTLCTAERAPLLGEVVAGAMHLSTLGAMVQAEWLRTPTLRPQVTLDEYVIVPNHVHGILVVAAVGAYGNTPLQDGNTPLQNDNVPMQGGNAPMQNGNTSMPNGNVLPQNGQMSAQRSNASGPPRPAPLRSPSQTLGAILRGFKAATTARINTLREAPGTPVWQRNYYEHIIRNERQLEAIRAYIYNNPVQWAADRENPATW